MRSRTNQAVSEIETQLQQRPGHVVTTLRVEVVDGPDKGAHAVGGEVLSVGTARDNALAIGDFTVRHDRLMHAYWEEARNLGDPEVLREVAVEVGLADTGVVHSTTSSTPSHPPEQRNGSCAATTRATPWPLRVHPRRPSGRTSLKGLHAWASSARTDGAPSRGPRTLYARHAVTGTGTEPSKPSTKSVPFDFRAGSRYSPSSPPEGLVVAPLSTTPPCPRFGFMLRMQGFSGEGGGRWEDPYTPCIRVGGG